MFKKSIPLFIMLVFIFVLSSCSSKQQATEDSNNKIKVVVSFNAMREFAAAVGKDKIHITTLVNDGTEPHDFEPKVKDLKSIENAQVFVYNGLKMESWVDKSLQVVGKKNLVVVDASKGAQAIKTDGKTDPHLWLSLKGAEIQTENIKNALVKADPENKNFYEENYEEFIIKLEELYNLYNPKINSLSNKNFVTGHAAFAYLCRDFGLKQNSIEDIFAEGEPSAKKLGDITDYCKKNKIKTIFAEDMVSPKISKTLANEVDAKVEKIYTLEGKEDNKDYLQSMAYNLEKIYESLK